MTIPTISPIHDDALARALTAAIDNKTKPSGSLGMLESMAQRIGLIQRTTQPRIADPALIVFAGDHGVTEEGISAYPQSVTWQMVENFLAGGAAINVFARQNGCVLHIVDAGVNYDFGVRTGLLDRKIAPGTRNFVREAAMTPQQCAQAMERGAELAESLVGNVLGFGEMGIGNTTSAAAIMHALTQLPAADCVGAGTGLPAAGVLHKQQVVQQAVARHAVTAPLDVLATFGGFEIAMMVGAMLEGAAQRKVLLIDGFIVTSALLVAAKLQPAILDYCVFAHCSDEHGHRRLLELLGAEPVLQMGLRLGEGTGSVLALPMLQAAVNFLCEMATFDSAGVSGHVGGQAA